MRRRNGTVARALLIGGLIVALTACTGSTSSGASGSARGFTASASPRSVPVTDPAAETLAENAKPGSTAWRLAATSMATDAQLAGYTDATSVVRGQDFGLHVRSTLGAWTATAYRIGWYAGTGAREVWESAPTPQTKQPTPTIDAHHRVVAGWSRSLTVKTTDWPGGTYLLVLQAGGRWRYATLTVRSQRAAGRLVLVGATAMYQAYNAWGGYSLYKGPTAASPRASEVSFDRPYDGNGAPKMLSFDAPIIRRAEKLGLPLAYLTSADLERPGILAGALGVVSLGHDEYWSLPMRAAVTAARDAGVNVAFLGSNALYWRIRFADNGRTVVTYKIDAPTADPVHDEPATTAQWRQAPHADPENSLTGMLYECFPAEGAFVVRDPGFYLFAGTGVVKGRSYAGLAGTEVDRAYPIARTPANLQVVAHSPVTCGPRKRTYSDMTYYTTASGAGVVSVGTMRWAWALEGPNSRLGIDPAGSRFVQTVTDNILRVMVAGPMGRAHPAVSDLATLGASSSTSNGSGGPVAPRAP